MRIRIQALLCVMVATFSIAAASRAQQPAAPRAVVPLTTYAFGDIYKGETISQIFVIRNEGNADLIIKDFAGACGCEALSVDKLIAPGKEGRARIEINTASQPGGELFKLATLHTNDPSRPAITLTLTANVMTNGSGGPVNGVELRAGQYVGPVFVGPGLTHGFLVAPGKTRHDEFVITVERGPLTIQRIEGELKKVSARLETVEPGKQYKVVFENLPTEAPGMIEESIRLITDSPALPTLPLSVRIKVRPTP